jgi:DNA-binding transcriptional LysR family regulator
MTEAGRELYHHSVAMLREAERAENAIRAEEVEAPLTPRFVSNDMRTLKRAAAAGLGIVALPGYVCREEVRLGTLRRVLPGWRAEDSVLTAVMPSGQGVLPSVRAFAE